MPRGIPVSAWVQGHREPKLQGALALHLLCFVSDLIYILFALFTWIEVLLSIHIRWPSGRPVGQRRTSLAGWIRRPGRFPRSAQVPKILPKNPKLDRLQKFPNSVEMILRCIRWYPQRIKPHKLWKRCRSEYPSREVGFSQEILPRVKNRAHDEFAWFTWQGVHLMSFHELNPTQQPQNLMNSRFNKMVNRGKKEGKNQIQIILDQRLRSQRAWLLYFHDLPGLVVLQRITYRKLKHRHSINLPHSGSQQQ